jgi:Na+/H+ antiporter NhaD/arsenite permease-like protein
MTLVPLTIIISRKSDMNVLVTVILQTLAANIGSSLTPIGNPQNLYIFSYYNLTAKQFFLPIILFAASGLAWLYILNLNNPRFDTSVSGCARKMKRNRIDQVPIINSNRKLQGLLRDHDLLKPLVEME